ncbi:GAF domain-containing SpoIIE family protein phosphatase [Amycolatopsis sp. NBC_01286]|uniref:GAF domain-containing SpoIIE family protein phosphatase n=1 Tax=Amycolatopsis sp. NBC_01286 TaxID=2903560 RepID=UPI002E0EC74B|nr:SpoIIE family protein phosphatase [Amycolatopsis sp. NBC_01286]
MPDGRPDLVLCDPGRTGALHDSGLSARADSAMDRFAAMVRVQLRVPVALVSLVEPDRQVFPGMQGLPEPWATARHTPLSHSFCRHVVITGEPLVLTDARTVALTSDNLAIPDLGVVAYAGIPLTDTDGHVLGSLCAIDTRPRTWTGDEIATLTDLATMCATEIRLRLATRQSKRDRDRRDELATQLDRAHARNEILLSAAQGLAGSRTLEQIRHEISWFVSAEHRPTYIGLVVAEPGGMLRRVPEPGRPALADTEFGVFRADAALATAKAFRERRLLCYEDPAAIDAEFPDAVGRLYRDLRLHATACAPLVGDRDVLGVLTLGWDRPHTLDSAERAVITTLATYTAQALERVRQLERRISVARELQEAMLTDLPSVPGLRLAARYRPSEVDEAVGGDWYDAVPLPGAPALAVTVGDITGHDVHASTLMGQVRSMMRQTAWNLPDAGPAATVEALEAALTGLDIPASGTLLHAHLSPDGTGRWELTSTNAGHPPPILVHADGRTELLTEHDALFSHLGFRTRNRTDQRRTLEPGDLVFLYTDGLIERRGEDLDQAIDRLRTLLARLAGQAPEAVADAALAHMVEPGGHEDDVVLLAIGT